MITELEGKQINLKMTPKGAMRPHRVQNFEDFDRLQKWIASFSNTAYPFVYVWDLQAALAFKVYSKDGKTSWVEHVSQEDQAKFGITDQMLLEAVERNGAINISGNYPITEPIRQKLAEALE